MNNAKRIEQIAADNSVELVVRGNDRLAIDALAADLEIELEDDRVNDQMVIEAIEQAIEEAAE